MQILGWAYTGFIGLAVAIILLVVALIIIIHAAVVGADLAKELRNNAAAMLFSVLFNIQYAMFLALALSEAAHFSRVRWAIPATASSFWLFVVALMFTVSFVKVNYERIFRDGAKLFADSEMSKWFSQQGGPMKSAVGFWAAIGLFTSFALIFADLKLIPSVASTDAAGSASILDYLVFAFQSALEAIPFDLVQQLGIDVSHIHLSAKALPPILLFVFLFKFAIDTLVATAVANSIAILRETANKESKA